MEMDLGGLNNLKEINGQAQQEAAAAVDPESKAPSWRTSLAIHAAADRIPDASEDEKLTLAADLARHGQRQPIILVRVATRSNAAPQLLDGRTRLDLLAAAGVEVVDVNGKVLIHHRIIQVANDAEAEQLSLSLNVHRRQLTAEQKRELIAEQLKADPSKSDRQIAETVKASPTTVGGVRAEIASTVQSGQLPEKRVGKDGKARKLPSKTRKPPNRVRATIYREGKLGEETVAKLDGTSLGSAREMDELVILNRAAPEGEHTEIVKQLVADAVAGKAVSAIEYSKNEALKSRDDIAPANASDADAALKPSHERAARKLLNHFGQAPGEVQRHFLQLVRNDIGPNSTTEIERQAVEIEELRNAKRRLQIKIEGLESEVEESKAEKSSLSNLIVLLREILAETIDAPWIKPLSTRKRQQAKKLLEQLQGDIYELVKLREVAAKGMPHAAAQ